jgi:hypothetical protein
MIFGNKDVYAIEVYHEPLDNDTFYMTGRMCIFLHGLRYGDIDDPACVLYVPYIQLLDKVKKIEEIRCNFNMKTDADIFEFLDVKLYMADDDVTYEQILIDLEEYGKFDFLTGSGEMFDRTKSFIYCDNLEIIHILYQIHNDNDIIRFSKISKEVFLNVSRQFINWYEEINGANIVK